MFLGNTLQKTNGLLGIIQNTLLSVFSREFRKLNRYEKLRYRMATAAFLTFSFFLYETYAP